MMHDGKDWKLIPNTVLIDKIYDNKKNYIEENVGEHQKDGLILMMNIIKQEKLRNGLNYCYTINGILLLIVKIHYQYNKHNNYNSYF